MDWQEEMFILSCALYEAGEETVLNDKNFDYHSNWLMRQYDELSPEFRARASKENLECGSALGLIFTDSELIAGREWRERIKAEKAAREAKCAYS